MHIKIFFKKLASICVAVVLAVTQAACFDLGDFSDDSAYYDAFGDIRLVYNESTTERDIEYEDYDLEDYFYNKNTGENFSYGNPEDDDPDEGKKIPQLAYLYMAIPVEINLRIESIALYFNALTTCSLKVEFYVVEDLPDGGNFEKINIKLSGDPEYPEDEKTYSDPTEAFCVGKTTVNVQNGRWIPLVMDDWDDRDFIEVPESHSVLLRFINNGGANTDEEQNPPVQFCVTNLLIRAFS